MNKTILIIITGICGVIAAEVLLTKVPYPKSIPVESLIKQTTNTPFTIITNGTLIHTIIATNKVSLYQKSVDEGYSIWITNGPSYQELNYKMLLEIEKKLGISHPNGE